MNNQRYNLREATRTLNTANKRKTGKPKTSRFKGVFLSRNYKSPRWCAQINHPGGKKATLGVYRNEEEAARAYDKAALELFGEFAALNFPNEKGQELCR